MANFEPIVQWVLYQEDDKRTPGKIVNEGDGAGFTRLGITSKWHSNDVPANFFTDLPFADAVVAAKIVYRGQYWNLFQGDHIQFDIVAAPILSLAVNDNPGLAVKTLQRALGLHDDGVLGPITLAEVNSKDPVSVARLYRAEWANFYHRDVDANPSKAEFLNGWLNRVNFPYPAQIPQIYA